MDPSEIFGEVRAGEDVISVLPIGKVVVGKISPTSKLALNTKRSSHSSYPERMTSSSIPYSFMCCNPQPSLIRRGMVALRMPVKFGVWNMRISTLLSPNSSTRGARRDADDGSGVSRVPRRASVSIDTRSFGFLRNASRIVDIWQFGY